MCLQCNVLVHTFYSYLSLILTLHLPFHAHKTNLKLKVKTFIITPLLLIWRLMLVIYFHLCPQSDDFAKPINPCSFLFSVNQNWKFYKTYKFLGNDFFFKLFLYTFKICPHSHSNFNTHVHLLNILLPTFTFNFTPNM